MASPLTLDVGTGPGLALEGPRQIGWLCFDALPGPSAFVPLVVTNVQGLKTNGGPVGGTFGQSGRVLVIGVAVKSFRKLFGNLLTSALQSRRKMA
jgi:hypothetical protein